MQLTEISILRKYRLYGTIMNTRPNGKEYIRGLINIAYLSIGAPLLLFIWVYLESTSLQLDPLLPGEPGLIVFFIVLIITIAMVIYAHLKYRSLINIALQVEAFTDKLKFYRQAIVWRYVTFGVVSLLSAIGLFLTDVVFFEPLFFVMVILVSIYHPNAQRLVRELQLRDQNRDIILKGLDF